MSKQHAVVMVALIVVVLCAAAALVLGLAFSAGRAQKQHIDDRKAEYRQRILAITEPPELPRFAKSGSLVVCLFEFRDTPETKSVMNAVARVYGSDAESQGVGAAVVCGSANASVVRRAFAGWKNLMIVELPVDNPGRREYNALMKTPEVYELFSDSFSHMLVYQTDAVLFRKIPEVYFSYDYIGAPWAKGTRGAVQTPTPAGNGGFSLRRLSAIKRACEANRGLGFREASSARGRELPEDVFFSSMKDFVYPDFWGEAHRAFSVESVYHKAPVGCHQPYLCAASRRQWKRFLARNFGLLMKVN